MSKNVFILLHEDIEIKIKKYISISTCIIFTLNGQCTENLFDHNGPQHRTKLK